MPFSSSHWWPVAGPELEPTSSPAFAGPTLLPFQDLFGVCSAPLALSRIDPSPHPLLISLGCFPNSMHPQEMKPAILKLLPRNSPQAAAGWVWWALLKPGTVVFYIITKTRCMLFRKLKNIYMDKNKQPRLHISVTM